MESIKGQLVVFIVFALSSLFLIVRNLITIGMSDSDNSLATFLAVVSILMFVVCVYKVSLLFRKIKNK